MSPRVTPAAQNASRCGQVPRLPRKGAAVTGDQVDPSAPNPATSGSLGGLNGESLDRNILSNLSAHLAILSNILAQNHAANQEIPTDLADDST